MVAALTPLFVLGVFGFHVVAWTGTAHAWFVGASALAATGAPSR